jgi:hypothetical protein
MTKRIKAKTSVNNGWVEPKPRKRRKPMTPEQKAAAAERLAKARAAKGPAKNTSLHHSLIGLSEEHILHPDKVKKWIKTQKELASVARSDIRRNIKGAEAQLSNHEGYIRQCNTYLRNGDWCDNFYGEHQEKRIKWQTIIPKG